MKKFGPGVEGMAIAKPSSGVTIGYKPKAKRVERRKPTWLQWTAAGVIRNGRELCEFAADEIVYATMDTARLLNYLRYEFGLAGMRRRTTDVRRTTMDDGLVTLDGKVIALSADRI